MRKGERNLPLLRSSTIARGCYVAADTSPQRTVLQLVTKAAPLGAGGWPRGLRPDYPIVVKRPTKALAAVDGAVGISRGKPDKARRHVGRRW